MIHNFEIHLRTRSMAFFLFLVFSLSWVLTTWFALLSIFRRSYYFLLMPITYSDLRAIFFILAWYCTCWTQILAVRRYFWYILRWWMVRISLGRMGWFHLFLSLPSPCMSYWTTKESLDYLHFSVWNPWMLDQWIFSWSRSKFITLAATSKGNTHF